MKITVAKKNEVPWPVKYDNRKKTRDEWRKDRSTYVGASDVCAILGVSKYRGPYEVAAIKLGKVDEFNGNAVTRLGTLMERPILEYWAYENEHHADDPIDCVKVKTCPFTLHHVDHPELACNLDAFGIDSSGVPFVIEIKHTGIYGRQYLEEWQNGETPRGIALEYYTQVQAQLAVTGCANAILVSMCDKRLFVIRVKADVEAVGIIVSEIPAYWERYISAGELPPPSHADGPAIAAMYPPRDPDAEATVIVRPDMSDRISAIRRRVAVLESQIVKDKKHQDTLKNEVKAVMGDNETMYLDEERSERPVKWRTVQQKAGSARRPYRIFKL